MKNENIKLLKQFNKTERKIIEEAARRLADEVKNRIFDKIPSGCAYCDFIELIAERASDMTFEDAGVESGYVKELDL